MCAMYFPGGAQLGSSHVRDVPSLLVHFVLVKTRPSQTCWVPVFGTGFGCGQIAGQPTSSQAPHAVVQLLPIVTLDLSAAF